MKVRDLWFLGWGAMLLIACGSDDPGAAAGGTDGVDCAPGLVQCDGPCGGGECVPSCDGFPEQCEQSCTDTDIDPLHCGECDERCDADEVCIEGECRDAQPAQCNTCPCDPCDGSCCETPYSNGPVCVGGDACGG